MPAIYHSVFSAAHILSLGLLVIPHLIVHVAAKPIPVPMPFAFSDHYGGSFSDLASSDPAPRGVVGKHSTHLNGTQGGRAHAFYAVHPVATPVHNHADTESRRAFDNDVLLNNINILNAFYGNASENAGNLQTYAAQSSNNDNVDSDAFNQQCASELQAYRTNILGFQSVLAQLGADKGLANYDRTDDLETLLKNLVNLNKNALKSIDELVYAIPGIGPVLGPIVYEIKCILDDLLDATENLTDAIVNALQPLLRAVIGGYASAACNSGVVVAGLCL